MNQTNILIIGYGYVGKAVHFSLTESLEQFSSRDFAINVLDLYSITTFETTPDAIFICVPTPSLSTGECDISLVEKYVRQFSIHNNDIPIVVKSTIPPSAVEKLLKINPNLIIMPEFLREKFWQEDCINPNALVVGGRNKDLVSDLVNILYNSKIYIRHNTIRQVDPIEASIFKYAANSFLAYKLVFMHEFHKWTSSVGYKDEWTNVATLLKQDPRIGETHIDAPGVHGLGFAGSCFPKDMDALINESAGSSLNQLLNYVQYRNTRLQNSDNEL